MGSMDNIQRRKLHDDVNNSDDGEKKSKPKKVADSPQELVTQVTFQTLRDELKPLLERDTREQIKEKILNKNSVSETEEVPKKKEGFSLYKLILPVIILLLAMLFFVKSQEEEVKPQKFVNVAKFRLKIKAISKRLKEPTASGSPLKIVNKTLVVFLKELEHTQPAVILLLGSDKDNHVCCFLWDIVDSLNYENHLSVVHLKPENFAMKSENEGKAFIEETINRNPKNGTSLIILENIDYFPVNTLSKLHTYFDNENAPHKDAIFLLTARTDITKGTSIDVTKIHFDKVWAEYKQDHRRALLGRMVTNVALLRQSDFADDSCKSETQCKN